MAQVSVSTVRLGESGPTTVDELRALTQPEVLVPAAAELRGRPLDVVLHASTTTGYVLGRAGEQELAERLADLAGVPAVVSAAAAVEALRARDATRLLLVHPPWINEELDELGVAYFRDQGFDVTFLKADDLTSDPSRVETSDVVDRLLPHLGDDDSAVFLAGNGFRAAGAVAELEQRTGRLVLQANQVLLWSALAATDASAPGRRLRAAVHGTQVMPLGQGVSGQEESLRGAGGVAGSRSAARARPRLSSHRESSARVRSPRAHSKFASAGTASSDSDWR